MSSPSSIASSSNDNVPPSRRPPPPQQRSVTPTPTPQDPTLSMTSEPPRFHKGGRHGRNKLKGRGGAKAAAAAARRKSSSSLSSLSELNPDSTMDDSTARDDTQQSSEPSPTAPGPGDTSEQSARPNPDDSMDVDNDPPATTATDSPKNAAPTRTPPTTRSYNFRQRGNGRKHGGRNNQNQNNSKSTNNNNNTQGNQGSQKRGGKAGGGGTAGVKKNYGHLNNNSHPPTSNSSKLNRVRSITSSTNNTTLPGQRHGMPIVSTWDIPPPIPRNQQQQTQKSERPTWDHYTNLSLDDLDRAKDLVLDLLGWGVDPSYLLEAGVSAELIHRVFTDLNLRLPRDFVPPPPTPHSPQAPLAMAG